MIIPTLRVGMPLVTLRVTLWDAEHPELHSHAEGGNDRHKKNPAFEGGVFSTKSVQVR